MSDGSHREIRQPRYGASWLGSMTMAGLEEFLESKDAEIGRLKARADGGDKQLVDIGKFLGNKDARHVEEGEKSIAGLVTQEFERLKRELAEAQAEVTTLRAACANYVVEITRLEYRLRFRDPSDEGKG